MKNHFNPSRLPIRLLHPHTRNSSLPQNPNKSDHLTLGALLNLSQTSSPRDQDSSFLKTDALNPLTFTLPTQNTRRSSRPLDPIHRRSSSGNRPVESLPFPQDMKKTLLKLDNDSNKTSPLRATKTKWLYKNMISLTPCDNAERLNQTLTQLEVKETNVQTLASTLNMYGSFVLKKPKKILPKIRRHESVGKKHQGDSTPTSEASLGSIKTLSRLSSKVLKDKSEQSHAFSETAATETMITAKAVEKRLLDNYEKKHESWSKSMKVLQDLTSQVEISHDYIMDYLQKSGSKGHVSVCDMKEPKENNAKNRELKEVLLYDLEEAIHRKKNFKQTNDMMKKEEFEEFGAQATMYFKKIAEELVDQGQTEGALMLATLNKVLAIELEDMFASYMLHIELGKKDPEKALIAQLMEERGKGKQIDMKMRIRKAAHDELMNESKDKVNKLKKERDELEEKSKKQEFVLGYLLGQIKEGLKKPMKMEWRSARRQKRHNRKRKFSLDLEAIVG